MDDLNRLLAGPVDDLRERVGRTELPLFPAVEPLGVDGRPDDR